VLAEVRTTRNVIASARPTVDDAVSPQTAAQLEIHDQRGRARHRYRREIPGIPVAAKTGTAQTTGDHAHGG